MKKAKLYLFLNSFPYGNEEDTFIIPELYYLNKIFDLTLISSAGAELYNENKNDQDKCEGINVVYYNSKEVKLRFKEVFSFFLSDYFVKELLLIVKAKKYIVKRIKKSVFFAIQAVKFSKWLCKKKYINNTQKALYYSYWYDYHVLGTVMAGNGLLRSDKTKVITRTHGYDLYDERVEKGKRQPYKAIMEYHIDRVIFASNYGCEYFKEKYGNVDKYKVFYLGAPAALKILTQKTGKKFRIVSCSSLVSVKRVELIIDALSYIRDLEVEWVHFGEGVLWNRILEYAEQRLGNHSNINYYFKGYVQRNEIYQYYEKYFVDCFLTVSESEGGCPVSIQEAMAHAIPIIGTDIGGITEMIKGNGILLPSNPSSYQIKEAIEELSKVKGIDVERMRARSLQIWSERYHSNKNAEQFVNYLKELASERGQSN